MSKIHSVLLKDIEEIKEHYTKVTEFAELLPIYSEVILNKKLTGDNYCELANRYKQLYADWGIKWYIQTPANYPELTSKHKGFVTIYINCMALFGDDIYHMAYKELHDTLPSIKVHFYDVLNSTFYFLPEEAEEGLEKLNNWYLRVKEKSSEFLKQQRKLKLQAELDKLNNEETK